MSKLMGELLRRLGMLLSMGRWRRELAEEMRLHRELRGEWRFGNELRLLERSQAQWGWTWLETWAQDIRHGLRLLRRTPLITALALVSLGLGIGATTTLFSLTDAVLLRPLAVNHPEQLAQVYTQGPDEASAAPWFTRHMWEQMREHQDVFSNVFAWANTEFYPRDREQPLWGAYASSSYFAGLGVHAEAGRLLGPHDDYRGCAKVAVISDAFWRNHFRGSPRALGVALDVANGPFTIVGVMPPGFLGTYIGRRADIVAPLCASPAMSAGGPDNWLLLLMGRRKPGVTLAAARTRLAAQAPGWMPTKRRNRRWTLTPASGGMNWFGRSYGTALLLLLGIALLVLLVACANLAALMLARAAARRQEIAVRRALGAGRLRLVRQLLTESGLLVLGGAALGVAFAVWACQAAERLLRAQLNLTLDGRVLLAALGLTLATAVLVGLAPALSVSRAKATSRAAGRRATVAAVAIAVILLAGAGLFLRSFAKLAAAPLGFDPAHVALVEVMAPDASHATSDIAPTRSRTVAALRALPGVTAASASLIVPSQGLQWDGPVRNRTGRTAGMFFNAVSPDYFRTLRTGLVAGRDFRTGDTEGAPLVVIVNQAAAHVLSAGAEAIGQPLWAGASGASAYEVIGVAEDAKYQGLRDPAPPQVYFALAQLAETSPTINFELRSPLPQATLAAEVHRVMRRNEPEASYQFRSFSNAIAGTLSTERLLAWLSGLFGGLALLLTAIGLYGIMAYNAERRKREFGIRLALGAEPRSVLRLALGDAAWVVGIGVAIGVPLAWVGARTAQAALSKLLYGLRPTDAATLGAAVVVLVAAALAAAWLPARRAARTDPMSTLRDDG
ncbi:MAG: FtsX-like permease family protein [Acidobacteria bacterium]|nr:MAG: FtsX-like permease family protein [Acidobacteriota bacterium]